jgi:hypothetical protein
MAETTAEEPRQRQPQILPFAFVGQRKPQFLTEVLLLLVGARVSSLLLTVNSVQHPLDFKKCMPKQEHVKRL